MRFSTDDGKFGFIVSPAVGRGMFCFQILVEGQVIGDEEPSIISVAMRQLVDVRQIDGAELRGLPAAPESLLETLRTNEVIHDDAMFITGAESLDRWLVFGFRDRECVTVVAQEYKPTETRRPVYISKLHIDEYVSIARAARNYWLEWDGQVNGVGHLEGS